MNSAFRSGTSSRARMVQKVTRSLILISATPLEALTLARTRSRPPALADVVNVYCDRHRAVLALAKTDVKPKARAVQAALLIATTNPDLGPSFCRLPVDIAFKIIVAVQSHCRQRSILVSGIDLGAHGLDLLLKQIGRAH